MARLLSGSGTISGGATQAELDAFVGSTNIATVGTVGTGTWEATDVAVAHGGTGASTHTANNVLIGAGTSAITNVAPSTSGNVLTSNGTVWASAAASGGIADPGSSTDEALLRWNGASGDTVADSAVKVDDTGRMTNTTQPCFSAYPASQQNNFPASTNTTVVWGTEVFDIGGNFASNTFTAPVTGKYFFGLNVNIMNMQSAADYYQVALVTNNITFYSYFDPGAINEAGSHIYGLTLAVVAHLDSGHTAYVTVNFAGPGAHADISQESYFTGYLVS